MDAYRRDVRAIELPDGQVEVTETTRFRTSLGMWGAVVAPPLARSLRRTTGRTTPRSPVWAPPDALDARAGTVLGLLLTLALLAGYLGTVMTQTITFAADEFDRGTTAQGNALAAVRIGALGSLALVALADRRGRRKLLLGSLVGAILATAAGALAPTLRDPRDHPDLRPRLHHRRHPAAGRRGRRGDAQGGPGLRHQRDDHDRRAGGGDGPLGPAAGRPGTPGVAHPLPHPPAGPAGRGPGGAHPAREPALRAPPSVGHGAQGPRRAPGGHRVGHVLCLGLRRAQQPAPQRLPPGRARLLGGPHLPLRHPHQHPGRPRPRRRGASGRHPRTTSRRGPGGGRRCRAGGVGLHPPRLAAVGGQPGGHDAGGPGRPRPRRLRARAVPDRRPGQGQRHPPADGRRRQRPGPGGGRSGQGPVGPAVRRHVPPAPPGPPGGRAGPDRLPRDGAARAGGHQPRGRPGSRPTFAPGTAADPLVDPGLP